MDGIGKHGMFDRLTPLPWQWKLPQASDFGHPGFRSLPGEYSLMCTTPPSRLLPRTYFQTTYFWDIFTPAHLLEFVPVLVILHCFPFAVSIWEEDHSCSLYLVYSSVDSISKHKPIPFQMGAEKFSDRRSEQHIHTQTKRVQVGNT